MNNWYYDPNTNTGSYPWVNVGGIYNFITTNTGRGPYGFSSGDYMCYLQGGDLIVMKFYGTSTWRHTVVVTGLTGSCHDYTKIQVAGHSPKYHSSLVNFAPSYFYALNISGYRN